MFKKGQISCNKGKKLSEEHKLKISKNSARYWLGKKRPPFSKEWKEKLSLSHLGKREPRSREWQDKINESNRGQKRTKTMRLKMSLVKKGKKRIPFSEEHLKNMSKVRIGKKHWNWQGGKTFKPYPENWTKTLRKAIRERDNYTCQICRKKQSIIVHHIDYDKKNCDPDNLIVLCVSCHMKTNYYRKYWINKLQINIYVCPDISVNEVEG